MPLIVLDGSHNLNGTDYGANSVISVADGVADWLVGIPKAREIVAGPTAWAAGSYAQSSLVTHLGRSWVNNSAATAGDVPGTAAKWVEVTYLVPAAAASTGTNVADLVRGEDGFYYRASVVTVDGVKALTIDQSPVA